MKRQGEEGLRLLLAARWVTPTLTVCALGAGKRSSGWAERAEPAPALDPNEVDIKHLARQHTP